jgi:hypothetical protein
MGGRVEGTGDKDGNAGRETLGEGRDDPGDFVHPATIATARTEANTGRVFA